MTKLSAEDKILRSKISQRLKTYDKEQEISNQNLPLKMKWTGNY